MTAMSMPGLSRLTIMRPLSVLLGATLLGAALAACVPVAGYDDYGIGSSSYVAYGAGYGGWGPGYRVGPYAGPGYRRGVHGWGVGRPGRIPSIPRGRPAGGRGPGRR